MATGKLILKILIILIKILIILYWPILNYFETSLAVNVVTNSQNDFTHLWLLFKRSRKKPEKNKLFITGILLDTSRNYFTVEVLKRLIDGMSYNKLNVFHWHITDTARFTFNSFLFWTSLLDWRFLESRICTRPCSSKVLSHSHFLNFKLFCHQAAKPFWRPFYWQ